MGIKMNELEHGSCEAFGLLRLSTENAVKASPTLTNAELRRCNTMGFLLAYSRIYLKENLEVRGLFICQYAQYALLTAFTIVQSFLK